MMTESELLELFVDEGRKKFKADRTRRDEVNTSRVHYSYLPVSRKHLWYSVVNTTRGFDLTWSVEAPVDDIANGWVEPIRARLEDALKNLVETLP